MRLSQRWLAGKIGVTHTTVKNWLNGGGTRDSSLLDQAIRHLLAEQRARETRAESSVTLTPEAEARAALKARHPLGSTAIVPLWRGVVAGDADECHFAEGTEPEWVEIPAFLLTHEPERYFVAVATGSSMSPRIGHSDRAVVRLDANPPKNSLCVVRRPDGVSFVKLLREGRFPRPYELHSLNDAFEPILDVKGWTFVGVVVAVLKDPEPGSPNIEWNFGQPLKG